MDLVAAHHIHRGQHPVGGQGTVRAFPHVHAAEGDRSIGGLGARFAGAQGRQYGGHHCLGSHLFVPQEQVGQGVDQQTPDVCYSDLQKK